MPLFPLKDGQTVLAQPTQRWAALPTFVNEKVVHMLEKCNIVLNFETKVRQRLSLCAFELILTKIQSENIDKSAIISTRRWTNSLGAAHSRMGGPTFVNEKVVYIVEQKLIIKR